MNYFSYVLGCSIFGNALLEAALPETIPTANKTPSFETKKIPRKKRQSKRKKAVAPPKAVEMEETPNLEDFETKIKYEESKKKSGEIVVEVKYPDGMKEMYVKIIKDAMTAFPNEALKKCLEEEEFYDEKKEFVLQAISEKSIEKLKKVLTNLNPQEFIAHCPNLLDEVLWCLREMDADEKFRETIMNALKRFGYFIE